MNISLLKSILLLLASILLISACSSDDEGENSSPQPLIGQKPYDIGICDHSPRTGQTMPDFNAPTPIQNSGFFNKQFLFEPFLASLKSSSLSIAQVLQREGVNLFQVQVDPSASCRYFDFLFEAPIQQLKSWESVTYSNQIGSRLLGLFTTYYNKNKENLQVNLSDSTIMVRSDTQKWTLIHEMAHYLFARGRITELDMPFNKDLEAQIERTLDVIEELKIRFDNRPNAQLAHNLVDNYQGLFKLTIELDARGPLEEFTIEAMLSDQAARGEIKDINMGADVSNSFNYMVANSSIVLPTYRIFRRQLESFDFSNFPKKQKAMNRLIAEVQYTIDFVLSHLNSTRATRRHFIEPTGLVQTSLQSPKFNHHHFDLKKVTDQHKRLREFLEK